MFSRDPKGSAGGFQIEDCGLMIAKAVFQSAIRNHQSEIINPERSPPGRG
jgi:hypothetical protein